MDNKELFDRLDDIEYLLRYYSLECDHENALNILIKAVGQMGEASSLISKLMDEIEPKDTAFGTK